MAEDQTQQTRVLVINGQTIIVQGGTESNSLNEINTDLIQQALQEVSDGSATVVDDSNTYITPDAHADEGSNNNIVGLAILQGEQGDTTTIQLTAEQAEALGLSFANGEPVLKEEDENDGGENMLITDASGEHHLIYTDGSLKDEHGFVFDTGSNNDACSKMVSVENDHESVGAQTGSDSLSVLSTPVGAFLGSNSNQPLSLIPQIVNGQVTYTVKIHDDGGKGSTPDHLDENNDFINDSVSVNTITTSSFEHSENGNITSYVTSSIPSLSYGSTVSTPVSIQTLSMGEYQTQNVEPGSILTDSQTNISYVILPSSSTGDEASVVAKPSIPVQQVPAFVPFPPVASSNQISASDAQGSSISEVYSTVTAVDTSGEAATPASSPASKSVVGIPIASMSSDVEPIVSGTLSSVTGSLAGGLIRVVSSNDRNLLQPNVSGGKFTSILSSTGRLIPSITSAPKLASKPAAINSTTPKITVTYPRSYSGATKVASTPTISSAAQSLPVTSVPKIIVSQSIVSNASVLPTSSTSVASILPASSLGTAKSSSVPTVSTAKSLSNILATKVVSSSSNLAPRIMSVSSQARTLGANLAPKIVSASSSGSKVVTVNSTGPKIITVNASSGIKTASDSVSSVVSATLSKMPPAKANSNKPLGSSENPIQLVQHGQTFHSMQSLSDSQLRQIATVLQQQNLDATSRSKNVLYDAETKTRIIYRVVYPEDLDIGDPGSPSDIRPSRGRGRRGRPPKSGWRAPGRGYDSSRSIDLDLDEDRLLDDSSKGERKKQLPRTRSGRLSRPPRHMVKDYKRLHHLDFADADLDDSDGGYSDYQMSEHEEVDEKEKLPEVKELLPGLVVRKRKISSHFRCPTCQKIYLGHSRMARHFEAFPDHGSIDQIQVPPARTELKPDIGTINGLMRTGPGRRRGKRRGPWAHLSPEVRSQRRKIRLKELLATYTAEELAEVCGPAVAGLLPLWDLLLMRAEAVRADDTCLAAVLEEVQALLGRLQAVAGDVLLPVDDPAGRRLHRLEIQDKTICALLDIPCGVYAVDDRCLRTRDQHVSFDGEPYGKRSKLMEEDEDVSEGDEKLATGQNELDCDARVTNFSLDTELSERDKDGDVESATAKTAEEESEFLLQSSEHVDDEDGAAESDELPESTNTSSQSFSDPDQHTKALQTVDEIVNESLKNLEFSVSDMVHVPQRSSSHRDDGGEKDATSKFSVSSYDPEISLGAMREGGRTSCGLEDLNDVSGDSRTLYDSRDSRREKVGLQTGKGHSSFVGSSHINRIGNSVKFKKELQNEVSHTDTSFSENASSHDLTMHDDVDQNLHGRTHNDKHDRYRNHLRHVRGSEEAVESYDSEMALRTVEDDQPVSPSKVDQLEYSPSVKMEVSEGEGTPTYILTGIVEENEEDGEVTQEHFSFHQEMNEDGASVDFNTELGLPSIKDDGAASVKAENGSSSSFVPEMAEQVKCEEPAVSSTTYRSQQQASASESSGQMFGPVETLADMGGADQEGKPATFQPSENPLNTRPFHSSVGPSNGRQFQLQCGSEPDFMEVSLDESGPELDFEALSEEFNQNTRHS
ncbi:uncharacterized protein LOC134539647 [Bacillus rossius redtenbacheri]|uniref:uncharacterized protein LOC134539647 n=1 Tax=Bacillus rossius redtenbacheri TaxID=93214 RepID=UPI002FDEA57C